MRRIIFATAMTAAAGIVLAAAGCGRRQPPARAVGAVPFAARDAASTSRDDLQRTVVRMRDRLASNPGDAAAAVALADALLRQTRVAGNAGLAIAAEQVIVRALVAQPDAYELRRSLAAVYASQHRFRDAVRQAERCLAERPADAWIEGVLGDAHLELGEYSEAFDAFDRMSALKPNAAAYARASYAQELQGHLGEARRLMQMATDATPASDPESLAWHHAQLGHLWLAQGRIADAQREFAHADHAFPGHPLAADGLVRVRAAAGDYAGALTLLAPKLAGTPGAADLALAGDLAAALGRDADAERFYRLAETIWRSDAPEPTRLARFLAERGRHLDEARRVADAAWADRHDIFTADAVAWTAFEQGRIADAAAAIGDALRTGTRDRVILYHAAAIARASGRVSEARRLVDEARAGAPHFDVIGAREAAALQASLGTATWARR